MAELKGTTLNRDIVVSGIVTMNTFPAPPTLESVKAKIPFLCFRVVTRGLYPDLVKTNVERNIKTCYKVGLDNFKFEVVTDNALNLPKSALVRELVVPNDYQTLNNSLLRRARCSTATSRQ
jgi:egghead protein (zeste-white 4 protein)